MRRVVSRWRIIKRKKNLNCVSISAWKLMRHKKDTFWQLIQIPNALSTSQWYYLSTYTGLQIDWKPLRELHYHKYIPLRQQIHQFAYLWPCRPHRKYPRRNGRSYLFSGICPSCSDLDFNCNESICVNKRYWSYSDALWFLANTWERQSEVGGA